MVKLLLYAIGLVMTPTLAFHCVYPEVDVVAFVITLSAAVVFVYWLERREAEREYNLLMNDAHVFGAVVRQYWQEDPISATALWKRVHPNFNPPWHQPPSGDEEGS